MAADLLQVCPQVEENAVQVFEVRVVAQDLLVQLDRLGALAGSDAVYDAAFRRAGMLRVTDLDELFDAAETLATARPAEDDRLAILTNGGGIGVLATESLVDEGGTVAELRPDTIRRLDEVLPVTWSHGNPVDIIGDAPGKRYADSLEALLKDPNNDGILVMNCPTAVADSSDAARAVIETYKGSRRPLLTTWLGEGAAAEPRRMFAQNRIPTYETPGKAVKAFMHLVRYHRNQELLMETPQSVPELFDVDSDAVRAIIDRAMAEGRKWLTEFEAKQALAAYGVPVVDTRKAATPEEAGGMAAAIGKAVALKILSPDIVHKSDIGGVKLRLQTPDEVKAQAEAMLERVREVHPDADIEGFTVQEMAVRPHAHELIIGMVDDVLFGPVILFGQGGTEVEVVGDKALALPPLNMTLAREMMQQTRIHKLLKGYRARPAADLDGISLTLLKVSQLISDFAEIAELDINPLFADEDGVLLRAPAVDERARVFAGNPSGVAGGRRDLRIERLCDLEVDVRAAGADVVHEGFVESKRFFLHRAGSDGNARFLKARDAAAADLREGILHRNDDARNPVLDDRVRAGRRLAVVTAGLEVHVERRPSEDVGRMAAERILDRPDLGVGLPVSAVPSLSQNLLFLVHQHRADEGVRAYVARASASQFEAAAHPAGLARFPRHSPVRRLIEIIQSG